jgi:hypothetical protein
MKPKTEHKKTNRSYEDGKKQEREKRGKDHSSPVIIFFGYLLDTPPPRCICAG